MDHEFPKELPTRPSPPQKKSSSLGNSLSRLLKSPAVKRYNKVLARSADVAVAAAAAKKEEKTISLSSNSDSVRAEFVAETIAADSDSVRAESVAETIGADSIAPLVGPNSDNKPEPALIGTELDDEDRAKTGARMSDISQLTDEEKIKELIRARDTRAPSGHYFLGVYRDMSTSPGYFGYNAAKGMTGK